jgi:hypothetical protein
VGIPQRRWPSPTLAASPLFAGSPLSNHPSTTPLLAQVCSLPAVLQVVVVVGVGSARTAPAVESRSRPSPRHRHPFRQIPSPHLQRPAFGSAKCRPRRRRRRHCRFTVDHSLSRHPPAPHSGSAQSPRARVRVRARQLQSSRMDWHPPAATFTLCTCFSARSSGRPLGVCFASVAEVDVGMSRDRGVAEGWRWVQRAAWRRQMCAQLPPCTVVFGGSWGRHQSHAEVGAWLGCLVGGGAARRGRWRGLRCVPGLRGTQAFGAS